MKKLLPYIVSIIYLLFGQVERALAQSTDFGSDALGGLVTASTRDVFDIVVGIVNLVLYFLGGIAVLLGLYAGWLWFTSRGNADQIKKAKGIMVSAVIGLLIIFASYAITNFVIDNLYRNTIGSTDTTPGDGGDGTTDIVACPPPITAGEMVVCSYSSSKPVGGYITISGWNFGDYVDTTNSKVSIGGTNANLISCNSRTYWNQRYTRGTNIYYQIKAIIPDVTTGVPHEVRVDNTVGGVARFATKSGYVVSTDTLGLNIACFTPDEGPRGQIVTVSGINFGSSAGTQSIKMTGWVATPAPGAAGQIDVPFTTWTDTSITFAIPNEALASWVNIANTEIGSGAPDSEYFKVTCGDKTNCASDCCSRGECRPLNICSSSASVSIGPHINYVTPDNGVEDNLITIQGSSFGTSGQVLFTRSGTSIAAQVPSAINPACSNLWTDTEIIVGVPALVTGDTYSVTVMPAGAVTPSNGISFTANNITRPGICAADKSTGSFGTPVTITGVNFVQDTGNTVKYGGYAGGNVSITEPSVAYSTVPNLDKGLVGVQINADSELSNPLTFAVTEAIAGDPNIVNITPETGPTGTYLTINGNNFGNSRGAGKVVFEQGASSIDASFDFPLQCSSSVWSSGRIIVKVPTIAAVGDYEVKVVRSDTKTSNTKTFAFTTGTPGPGLCAIFPNNGPKNSLVSFYGDNFDQANGQIKFYNNKSIRGVVGTALWSNNSAINIPVPTDADTGPVVVTSGSQDSNAFNFKVGSCGDKNDCASGETCCQNSIGNYCATSCSNARQCTYGWSFVTEATPPEELNVEEHWPACDSSCGNAAIGVSFNVAMGPSAAVPSNYTIEDITDNTDVTITQAELIQNPDDLARVNLHYSSAVTLTVGHTYRVTVGDNILSVDGAHLASPYFWQFTVGSGSCNFTGVSISPSNYTALRPSQTINYTAYPTAEVGSCGTQRLRCEGTSCAYTWSIDTPDIASIQSGTATVKDMKAQSTSTKIPSVINGTENVRCSISQGASINASARTSLSIDYTKFLSGLRMVAHYPECDNACLNVGVGLSFNSELDTNSVTNISNGTYIKIFDITGTRTEVTSGVTLINNPDSESIITIGHTPFVAGHRYEVTVSNQIKNVFGNAFAGTSWQFSIGTQECAVTGADVVPAAKTSTVNKNIKYTAQTISDTISCGRVPVNCTNCSYQWSVSAPAVASITNNNKIVAATTLSIGATDILCRITQTGRPTIDATKGFLTVTAPVGPTYGIPRIEYSKPSSGASLQCRNTAIEILFTEKMNLASIQNNLKLYDASNNLVAGTFSFATVDGAAHPGPANNQTKVIFSPTTVLAAGSTYHISIGTGSPPTGMVSINNVALNLDTAPSALQNNTWTFATGNEICKISYVTTEPSADSFTCGVNSCEDDDDNATNGNQHQYLAAAHSRDGGVIAATGLDYQWTVSPNENSVSLVNKTASLTTATAKENGQAAVSVTVSGTIAGVNLGTARASLPVTVFLCQHPWPSIDNFPWVENALNFSSYYCQQIDDNNISLPMLGEPSATLPASNPDISAGKILKEYIFPVNITTGANTETNFIIFRVMPNAGHLSVKDWYKDKFPGDALGTMTTVDGYEAMKVGNTIYISAANIDGSTLYTNIYIIAYSVGANAQTKNIYDQFVANFQLNTNPGFANTNDDNLCSNNSTRVCSSDLDCEVIDGLRGSCQSRSLKLRRDVKRITDLLPVQKYLATYGATHRACSQNSQISCTQNSQCGGTNTCVNYYPQLNAGTFVASKTNSKWPSWQQTFATDLKQTLPVDPINKFVATGCPNADPETCWNEATRTFACTDDSYIYGYRLQDSPREYKLYSNFEYDDVSYDSVTFASDLFNGVSLGAGVNSLGNISTDLSGYCSAAPVPPGANLCGNGRVDATAGETCDGGVNYAQCRATPSLGDHPWWNEQVSGCNPPGTTGQCTWYTPTLTAAMCGGYCGDSTLQTAYESCDVRAGNILRNGVYHCPGASADTFIIAPNCNLSCNMTCTDNLPAARCGDRVFTSGREACDPSASPNGLAGWDCPNNGNVQCGAVTSGNACGITCDNGSIPYRGSCGNGTIEGPELCDYGDYDTKTPALADNNPLRYTCSNACNFNGQAYCGDSILQLSYGEKCDNNPLTPILPGQSKIDNQYQCRMINDTATDARFTRCTLTAGGYCGDNIRQNTHGEFCDGTDYPGRPTAAQSSATNTYACAKSCLSSDPAGGYCGDARVQSAYEACDVGVVTQKNVELVFVFDVSRSLESAATNLCTALGSVLSMPGVNLKITVMPLADDNSTLTDTTADDMTILAPETCTATSCQHRGVFNNLVTNSQAFDLFTSNPNSYNNSGNQLRYLSFYDNNTNNITGGVSTFSSSGNDNGLDLNNCNDSSTISPGGRLENWGYATQKIAESYEWLDGYQRIIMPISDEYAWCGGDVSTGEAPKANENNSSTNDILVNIINTANEAVPAIHVSPVILAGNTNQTLAGEVAVATGGVLATNNSGWSANLTRVINSAFCDGDGNGTMDCTIPGYTPPAPDTTVPTPPTNLSAAVLGNQVVLNWTASTDPDDSVFYTIERAIGAGVFVILSASVDTNSFTDTGLLYNTAYRYRVQAKDSNGNLQTTYSNTANVNTGAAPVLVDPPSALSAIGGNKQVSLSWTASPSTILGYSIERAPSATGTFVAIATPTATSYADTGLADATSYFYRVRARSASGFSAYTSVVSATTLLADSVAPSVPQNVQGSPANNRVNLSWTASIDPEGSAITYVVERAVSSAPTSFTIVATALSATSYADTSVSNGTQYLYRVKARDLNLNQSAYSSPLVSVTPDNNTVAPNAPTLLSIIADSALKTMSLSWAAPLSGPLAVSYIIERSLTSAFDNFVTVGTSFGTSIVDNFSDLLPGAPQIMTNYWYRVRAVGTLGLQSLPLVGSMLFPDDIAPAPAPSALTARFRGTYVELNWTGSSDNIGVTNYVIQRSTAVAGPFDTTIIGATTSHNDSSFAANTTYYYQVAARDATGNTSGYSTQVSVLTRDIEAPTPAPVLTGTDTDPIITLSWTGAITDNVGVTNYIVRRSTSASGPFTFPVNNTPTASPWQDTSATLGNTYYYQVAAQDAAGNTSSYSNIESATSFNGPGKPAISNLNVGTFAVSFVINSTGGVNPRTFTIERAPISAPSNFTVLGSIAALTVGATPYTDSTVLGSTTYYYRVKCTDNNGTVSDYSDTVTANTLDSTPPVCPGPFTAVSSSGSITLSWPACTDNIAMKGYVIERSINGAAWSRLPNSSSPITTTDTTYVDLTVAGITGIPSISYRFRPVDTSDNTTGWTTRPTYVCNVAYCDQYDADPITNCMNSCQAVGHCCQPCYSMTNTYLGCQLINPALTSCQTVTLSSGTCR